MYIPLFYSPHYCIAKHHEVYRHKSFFQTPMTSRLSPFLNWRYHSFLRALHTLLLIQFSYSLIPPTCKQESVRSWANFLWGDKFWKLQTSFSKEYHAFLQRFTPGQPPKEENCKTPIQFEYNKYSSIERIEKKIIPPVFLLFHSCHGQARSCRGKQLLSYPGTASRRVWNRTPFLNSIFHSDFIWCWIWCLLWFLHSKDQIIWNTAVNLPVSILRIQTQAKNKNLL